MRLQKEVFLPDLTKKEIAVMNGAEKPAFQGLNTAQKSNFFSLTAKIYENYWRLPLSTSILSGGKWNFQTESDFLNQWIPQKDHLVIVDAGTSTGLYSRAILRNRKQKKWNTKIFAIDLSPAFIQVAKEKTETDSKPDIHWLVADLRKLPFQSECIDVVVSGGTYNELSDPAQCLSEIFRILKPGGIFISMHLLPATSFLGKIGQSLAALGGIHIQTDEKMQSIFQNTGFEIKESKSAYSIGMICCHKP